MCAFRAARIGTDDSDKFFCKLSHGYIVGRVTDVEYTTVGTAVLVFYDAHKRIDTIVDVGKAAPLVTAIHQLNVFTVKHVTDELGVNVNNGLVNLYSKIESLPRSLLV